MTGARLRTTIATALAAALAPVAALAQTPATGKGAEILAAKCLQCHADAMWRDQRQSARAWEATLYRMVGRGALWEADEIKQMATYLGSDFGPNVPKAAPATKQ